MPWARLGFGEMSVIVLATYVEGLVAAARCADAAIERFLTYGTLPELVEWFYDDMTVPGSDDWDESVLSAYWNTRTWRGVFRAWDECGRPEFDPSVWGGDDWRPEVRRAAQGNARLDAVGEMVFSAFPAAIERAARKLGWEVMWGLDFPHGVFPDGALALDERGLDAAAANEWVSILIPPAVAA